MTVSHPELLTKVDDGTAGQDILPLLLAPSPALSLHAFNAITALHVIAAEMPALAQLRALTLAMRWDIGIEPRDFIGNVLEGERWLVHAAGAVRNFPSSFLFGGVPLQHYLRIADSY